MSESTPNLLGWVRIRSRSDMQLVLSVIRKRLEFGAGRHSASDSSPWLLIKDEISGTVSSAKLAAEHRMHEVGVGST